MKAIPLTRGLVALVDDNDFEALTAYKWCPNRHRCTVYATRGTRRTDGGHVTVYMHRTVLERKLGRPLVKGEDADHVNGDGLDNRRENLRPATRAQNMCNLHRRVANPSSRYLGVQWHAHTQRWRARIRVSHKEVYLGIYQGEDEAALAREFYIAAHPELQARSNFSEHELTL